MKNLLSKIHNHQYGVSPNHFFFSPGRVNLIGEHTDYSGGYCFPMSIHLGIYASVSLRSDQSIYIYSDDFKDLGVFQVQKPYQYDVKKSYTNYIEGVLSVLEKFNISINQGYNISIYSTLPKSSGLSSSASLEVLILTIFNELEKLKLDSLTIATMSQVVENQFIGVSSGIMDQFVIVFGKKNKVLLLDTENLNYQLADINLEDYQLVLMNTNKKRNLVESNYNERHSSIQKAIQYFNKPLRKVTDEELLIRKTSMSNQLWSRFKHVVTENKRTLDAYQALIDNDYLQLGMLMNESHQSLKDDFEVS